MFVVKIHRMVGFRETTADFFLAQAVDMYVACVDGTVRFFMAVFQTSIVYRQQIRAHVKYNSR